MNPCNPRYRRRDCTVQTCTLVTILATTSLDFSLLGSSRTGEGCQHERMTCPCRLPKVPLRWNVFLSDRLHTPTVVSASWYQLTRLGFRSLLIIDLGCGIGESQLRTKSVAHYCAFISQVLSADPHLGSTPYFAIGRMRLRARYVWSSGLGPSDLILDVSCWSIQLLIIASFVCTYFKCALSVLECN